MRQRIHRVLITLGLAAATGAAVAQTPRTMLILDGSGSMWGQIQGTPKIDIARRAIRGMLADWPGDRELGLMVYGHRSEGDCTDIETLLAPASPDPDVFKALLADIQPRGKTPLSAAVGEAATALSHEDTPATVILVSDGRETCDADPCEAAATLARTGTDFTAHVIGFDVDDAARDELSCLAEATGGRYLAAADAEELTGALAEATAPAPDETAPLIVDDFDGAELGENWEIINPDPTGFILDNGALVSLTLKATQVGKENQSNVFRWVGQSLPGGDWDMAVDFNSAFTWKRSIIELVLYDDPEHFVSASLFGDGSSNNNLTLQVKSVVGDNVSRSRTRFASDSCCPRKYNLDAVLTALKEQGARLVLRKRGREYRAAIETPGWQTREGAPDPLVTEALSVLRASGQPALFSGTWGGHYGDLEQTATEFQRFSVTPR